MRRDEVLRILAQHHAELAEMGVGSLALRLGCARQSRTGERCRSAGRVPQAGRALRVGGTERVPGAAARSSGRSGAARQHQTSDARAHSPGGGPCLLSMLTAWINAARSRAGSRRDRLMFEETLWLASCPNSAPSVGLVDSARRVYSRASGGTEPSRNASVDAPAARLLA